MTIERERRRFRELIEKQRSAQLSPSEASELERLAITVKRYIGAFEQALEVPQGTLSSKGRGLGEYGAMSRGHKTNGRASVREWIRTLNIAAAAALLTFILSGFWHSRQSVLLASSEASRGNFNAAGRTLLSIWMPFAGIVLPDWLGSWWRDARDQDSALARLSALQDPGIGEEQLLFRSMVSLARQAHEGRLSRAYVEQQRLIADLQGMHGLQTAAAELATRFFLDYPLITIADVITCERVRDQLTALLKKYDLPSDAGLHVISALGGCGTIAEVEVLLDRLDQLDRDGQLSPEDERVSVIAVSRILRRALQLGTKSLPGTTSLYARIQDHVDRTLAQHALDNRVIDAWAELLESLVLVDRRVGRPSAVDPAQVAQFPDKDAVRLQALLKSPDPAFISLLSTGGEGEPLESMVRYGWCCAAYGNDEITQAVKERIQHSQQDLESFLAGVEEFQTESTGRQPGREPAPDTGLHEVPDKPEWEDQAAQIVVPEKPETLALWDFQASTIKLGGNAVAVTATTGRLVSEGTAGHWLFTQPGASSMRLAFNVGEAPIGGTPRLILVHHVNDRRALPLGGIAYLEVLLDGHQLDKGLRVTWKGGMESSFILDPTILLPGEHTITLRLVSGTSPMRLHKARIDQH